MHHLYIHKESIYDYTIDLDNTYLYSTNKVNLFFGANNSGKSRLLRSLLTDELHAIDFTEQSILDYIDLCRSSRPQLDTGASDDFANSLHRYDSIRSLSNYHPSMLINDANSRFNKLTKALRESKKDPANTRDPSSTYNRARKDVTHFLEAISAGCDPFPASRIYIPSLRGLRHPVGYDRSGNASPGQWINDDPYEKATTESYFPSWRNDNDRSVYTGLTMYETLREHLLGDHLQRHKVREFEDFLSFQLFNGQSIALTPNLKDRKLTIKIGDEFDRPIDAVGDGIQQMIILTWPAFMLRDNPLLLLIEEPELFLHPGAQRQLLKLFCERTGPLAKVTLFAATHSNHLMEIAMEEDNVSLYSFQKLHRESPPHFHIDRIDSLNDSILELIGARLTSVFRTNATIWVEGISDRIYLRKFIELCLTSGPCQALAARVREDWQYTICEYGGANMEHFDFRCNTTESANAASIDTPINASRLCARGLVIADTDSKKEKKHRRLTETLGAFYYPIAGREIENLLSPECLQKVLQTYQGGDALAEHSFPGWPKYKKLKIGTAIRKFRGKGWTPNSPLGAKPADGIADKLGFARKAVEHMTTWDDLIPGAQHLALRALAHVVRLNGLTGLPDRAQASEEMKTAFAALAPHISELDSARTLTPESPVPAEG